MNTLERLYRISKLSRVRMKTVMDIQRLYFILKAGNVGESLNNDILENMKIMRRLLSNIKKKLKKTINSDLLR